MNEKKVIVFIVEGPSDEAALGSIMKEYFTNEEVQFVVVHGDITLKDYVSVDTVLNKIHIQIEIVKKRYRYRQEDFLKIVHIVDMDGVYIPKGDIKLADVKGVQYYTDRIETKSPETIAKRNKVKADVLFKLRKTGRINNIPYRIYFNSCNLEHVLYDELKNFSDEEKEELSDDFAERYEGRVDEFIKFISDPSIAVLGTYQKTWDFIEKGRNSVCRHTNMNLIFDKVHIS